VGSCKHGNELSDSKWHEEKQGTEEIKEAQKSNKLRERKTSISVIAI
jgi:hypothetical protein